MLIHHENALMKKVTTFSFLILISIVFQSALFAAVAPRITLTSSLNPSTYGQNVTFTVHVQDSTLVLTPTGNVTFYDGAISLGNVERGLAKK